VTSNPERLLGQVRLKEADAFRNFIEALRIAEESARQIALLRDDQRWIMWGSALGNAREIAMKMANERQSQLVHPWVA
jgi:hypothetical protein